MYPGAAESPKTETEWFEALTSLARFLRGPGGCPWDRGHSASEFASDAAEEARELVDAFEKNDNEHVEEELGDVLFVLLASAVAAEEEGRFTLCGALKRAYEKMIRRHEHVFGEGAAKTAEEAVESWERVKAREKESSRD